VRVAVLGTGTMGAPMARHLVAAGHDVRVWNRTPSRAQGLGAEVAASPAEAVEGSEALLTMLADGAAVEEVLAEALPALAPGTLWAQTSTVGLPATERLAAVAAERELAFVDSPVLGTKAPAEQGTLVVLASGPHAERERAEQVLSPFSRGIVWVGDEPGPGQALKLIANHWILNTVENIGETVALAQALGVDPRRFLEAISGGNMDMPYAHIKGEAILTGDFQPSFTLRLARKDVGLVLEAAERAGLDLGLARMTGERMERAIELGHGDEDMIAAFFGTAPGGGAR
jgi:3-hydroxyisobutyrate dehydrogenase